MRRRHQQRGRWAWQTYALLLTVGVVSIYGFTRRRPQTPAATKQLRVTASSVQSSVRVVEEPGLEEERRKMWAVAVMLSMNPSLKADGWKPRSVKGSSSNGTCPVGGRRLPFLVLASYGHARRFFVCRTRLAPFPRTKWRTRRRCRLCRPDRLGRPLGLGIVAVGERRQTGENGAGRVSSFSRLLTPS